MDDAAVAGERVGVGELGHRPGGRRRRPPVVQPRQAHDAVPHEGAVAAGAPGGRVQIGRGGAHAGGDAGLVAAVHDGAEDPAGLDADVAGAVEGHPAAEAPGDLVEGLPTGQVRARGGHARDVQGHLRVVAPLARRVVAEAPAQELGRPGEGDVPRLVGRSHGVADCLAEQDPLDAVELGVGQGGGGACGTRHGARLRPTAAPRLPTARGPASAPGAGRVSSRGGTGTETGTAAPTAPTPGPEPPFLMRKARSDLRT